MCGIAGIYSPDGGEVNPELLGRMTRVLRHRGPDDEGYVFISTSTGQYEPRTGDDTMAELGGVIKHAAIPVEFSSDLGFGHRRLSIIDLSAAGHQPMSNEDGTIWIVHNGEIYNHLELREELRSRGHRFRSNTDTEVILHSYEQWGRECLDRFNGMWAFAIWDGRGKRLFCSRDRFGIKPFYYYFDGRRFLFASEIKAIMEADFIKRKPNDQTVFDYLAHRVEDCTEDTFFSGIKQLRGGHYLEFLPGDKELKVRRYYDIPLSREVSGFTDEEYARRFYELFEDSVRLRLISSVPLGSCLSGGLDSSSIVCTIDKLMRREGLKLPGREDIQKTFSARYGDKRHDEGFFIDEVARKTSVDARYTYPTGEGLRKEVSELIWHHGEPFTSHSTYARWEVFKLARQSGVKVALDGEGGDELLAGYDFYYAALFSYLVRTFQWQELTRECWFHFRLHGKAACLNLLQSVYHFLPQNLKPWMREVMRTDGRPCLSREFTAAFTGYPFRDSAIKDTGANFFSQNLYEKFVFAIIPGLLRQQDRNSMAHSIEARVPFLDYRLVEFAFAMPWEQKIRRGTTKFVLRNAMNGILPESVANRQDKRGFSAPRDVWLKDYMGDEVSEIINSQSFQQRPYFDGGKVKREVTAYQQGQRNIETTVWRWINLELWLRMFVD